MPRKEFVAFTRLDASDVNTYLMDQSVMTFASSGARGSAIASPTEGMVTYLEDSNSLQLYDGTSWGAVDTSGSGNAIINGAFDIFQRSPTNTMTITSSGYTLDRWFQDIGGSTVVSRQTTGVPFGSTFCMRVVINGAVANSIQPFENIESMKLWGKTVTLSVKLRRNSTFANNLTIGIGKNSTSNAAPTAAGWSVIQQTTITNANLPTGTSNANWFTATVTATIPSDGTANSIRVLIGQSAGESAGAYYEVAEVQLEANPVETPFRRNANSIQGELAACQRYYYRESATASAFTWFGTTGIAASTTSVIVPLKTPVPLRTIASSVEFSTLLISDTVNNTAVTSVTLDANRTADTSVVSIGVASGLTQFRPYILRANNSTSAFIGLSAEL